MEYRASTALTEAGLAALRRAAVMAHTVGAVHLRLSTGRSRIVEVNPDPAAPSSWPVIDPCRFRMAVAKAWADHSAGREIGLIGLAAADQLDIAWSVAPPGQDLGFGAVRRRAAGGWSGRSPPCSTREPLAAALGELDARGDVSPRWTTDGLAARLVHDDLLAATVVHVEADPPGSSTCRVLDEVLRRMVAAVTAGELVESLC